MKYKLLVKRPFLNTINDEYGTFIDDFLSLDCNSIIYWLNEMDLVLNGNKEESSIYGNICTIINFNRETAKIYYYSDTYIGKEPTIDIYNILKIMLEKKIENGEE
jgi:hypothetical protein